MARNVGFRGKFDAFNGKGADLLFAYATRTRVQTIAFDLMRPAVLTSCRCPRSTAGREIVDRDPILLAPTELSGMSLENVLALETL